MPFEPIYGLPYEAASDLPGWSLTGGPDGGQPVLAERVASQLRRLDDLIRSAQDQFGTYPELVQAGTGTVVLDTEITSSFYNANYWRGTTAVVFDVEFEQFNPTPAVMICAHTTVPGTVIECSVANITRTGFDALIARSNQTTTGFSWIASGRGEV